MKTIIRTKKSVALVACSALLAAALTGGLAGLGSGITAHADEGDAVSEPKVFYYVDAGNLVKDDGTTSDRGAGGSPSTSDTKFMTAYNLTYGSNAKGTRLYNSKTDDVFGTDTATGKEWGLSSDAGDYGLGDWWRTGKTDAGETLYDGYNTARHINESDKHEGILTYKFEVDDDTTPLKITIGTRTYSSGWVTQTYPYSINSFNAVNIDAKNNEITEYVSTALWADQTVTGVQEGDKYFVTLNFGGADTTASAYVNWIIVATADYDMYTLVSAKKGATTITATHFDGSGDVQATLTEESKTAIAEANIFDKVNVTATLENGQTITGQVTVIPEDTTYFVNVGGSAQGGLLADGEYSAATGYGYIEEGSKPHSGKSYPGSAEWRTSQFDLSCRIDMDTIVYQFDVTGKSYEVIVGVVEHYAQYPITGGRKHELSVNGGASTLITLPIENDVSMNGIAYGDAVNGQLKVKIDTACSEACIISYILVVEHTHDLEHHNAVASTCTEHGTVEYWSCDVCGQKYSDANATTLITDIEAPLVDHELTATPAKTATCTEEGMQAYWTCDVCGKHFSDANAVTEVTDLSALVIAKTPHNIGSLIARVEPLCETEGTLAHYHCADCGKDFEDQACTKELESVAIPALGHTFDSIEWGEWTQNDSTGEWTITYSAVCSREGCGEAENEAYATVTSAVTTAPTCTEKGVLTYTATAGNQTTTKDVEIEPLGHDYDFDNIVWNWEGYTCSSAYVHCSHEGCNNYIQMDVRTTSEITTYATCTTTGVKLYTATARREDSEGAPYTDTKEEVLAKLNHKFDDLVWGEWEVDEETGEDKIRFTASCSRDGCGEVEVDVYATITKEITKAPTCTEAGEVTYHAQAGDHHTEKTEVLAALGHDYDYENLVWTWNGTESATAKAVCKHDGTHFDEITATITSEVTKAATKNEEGVLTYTATITVGGQTYTDTRTEAIEKVKSGCGSVMSVGTMGILVLGLVAVGAVIVFVRKERRN